MFAFANSFVKFDKIYYQNNFDRAVKSVENTQKNETNN